MKVDFFQDDVTNLKTISISITYDLILDIGCFHGLPQRDRIKYITTVNRLLSQNGTFLLYVFFNEQVDANKPGVTEADIIQFSRVFNQISRLDGVERDFLWSAWFSFQKPV